VRCLPESLRHERREKVVCHQHKGGAIMTDRDEMRVLRGVVYITKSKGPRTEPCGTPYSDVCKEEKQSLHFTQKVREW